MLHPLRLRVSRFVLAGTVLCGCSAAHRSQSRVLVLTFEPRDSAAVTDAELRAARETIVRRFGRALRSRSDVVLAGNHLEVSLFDGRDVDLARVIGTQVGAIGFLDSADPVDTGTRVSAALRPVVTNADIADARPERDSMKGCNLIIRLSPEGQRKMAQYSADNIDHFVLLVRDGQVLQSARLMSRITTEMTLSGFGDPLALRVLNAELGAKPLPIAFQLASEDVPPEVKARPANPAESRGENAEGSLSGRMRLSIVVHSIPYNLLSVAGLLATLIVLFMIWRHTGLLPAKKRRWLTMVGVLSALLFVLPRLVIDSPAHIAAQEEAAQDA